jgi:hypothetical protein
LFSFFRLKKRPSGEVFRQNGKFGDMSFFGTFFWREKFAFTTAFFFFFRGLKNKKALRAAAANVCGTTTFCGRMGGGEKSWTAKEVQGEPATKKEAAKKKRLSGKKRAPLREK